MNEKIINTALGGMIGIGMIKATSEMMKSSTRKRSKRRTKKRKRR